jgi:cystathionine beta-lyase/cystathionine gamma-synthase
MKFSTKAIHAGQEPDSATGAVMPPVYLTSTFAHEELGKDKGFTYSRVSNPTRTLLEKNIAALESASEGLAFASGMAAIDALFRILEPGSHVIMSKDVYGGTYRLAVREFAPFGIEFDFVDTSDWESIKRAKRPTTRMIFIETPANPMMTLTDLAAVAKYAKKEKILTVADNTFATPYLQRPIEFGFDIVVHSVTKYLNGHSDMIGGFIATNNGEVAHRLRFIQKAAGAVMSPFDAWMCLRGTKTLAVRMDRHCANAETIAEWLVDQPGIRGVFYPGLKTHPQYALAKKQMSGFGGMIAFDTGSLANARKLLRRTQLCVLAESLGGVETLIAHPATMSHVGLPKAERIANGITDGLLRLSVGIEDVEDIRNDLKFALAGLK